MKCNFFHMNCIILDEAGCEIGMGYMLHYLCEFINHSPYYKKH